MRKYEKPNISDEIIEIEDIISNSPTVPGPIDVGDSDESLN